MRVGGADTLAGGVGDDTYVIDSIGDVVTENASEGMDLVQSSISYTLSANVENLTLTGSAVINGTGNVLNNAIIGNTGANNLFGGDGTDTLLGGDGNDTLEGGLGNDVLTGGVGRLCAVGTCREEGGAGLAFENVCHLPPGFICRT